jgi:hypothetical protein
MEKSSQSSQSRERIHYTEDADEIQTSRILCTTNDVTFDDEKYRKDKSHDQDRNDNRPLKHNTRRYIKHRSYQVPDYRWRNKRYDNANYNSYHGQRRYDDQSYHPYHGQGRYDNPNHYSYRGQGYGGQDRKPIPWLKYAESIKELHASQTLQYNNIMILLEDITKTIKRSATATSAAASATSMDDKSTSSTKSSYDFEIVDIIPDDAYNYI